jgi:hypothetical protein
MTTSSTAFVSVDHYFGAVDGGDIDDDDDSHLHDDDHGSAAALCWRRPATTTTRNATMTTRHDVSLLPLPPPFKIWSR